MYCCYYLRNKLRSFLALVEVCGYVMLGSISVASETVSPVPPRTLICPLKHLHRNARDHRCNKQQLDTVQFYQSAFQLGWRTRPPSSSLLVYRCARVSRDIERKVPCPRGLGKPCLMMSQRFAVLFVANLLH